MLHLTEQSSVPDIHTSSPFFLTLAKNVIVHAFSIHALTLLTLRNRAAATASEMHLNWMMGRMLMMMASVILYKR